jgi:signal peptidase I
MLCIFVLLVGGGWFFYASPYKTYVIHTGSMGDTIPSGSAVVVRKDEYHIGQVVSFLSNGGIVTHRLISINADGNITTKGDANSAVDPSHPPVSNIVGGVVASPHFAGRAMVIFRQPTGIPSFVCLFIAIVLWPPREEEDTQDQEAPELVASAA